MTRLQTLPETTDENKEPEKILFTTLQIQFSRDSISNSLKNRE